MSEITKYEIDMLNVKAADAFLIRLFVKDERSETEYVVLVDAGNEPDGDLILDHIREYYGKNYIDLAICTHCDVDHYGGFKRLIEEHCKHKDFAIGKIWIHDPYKHVDVDDVKYIRKEQTLTARLNEVYAFSDGTNLLGRIDKARIKREEPFAGKTFSLANITVLGPEESYYESLIPDFRLDVRFKVEEDNDYSSRAETCSDMSEDTFYSRALKEAEDDSSKANQSSVVFMFEAKGEIHLFTGDAGREALSRVIKSEYKSKLHNVAFLKVPHHGSKHNLDSEIINYLSPQISYISTEKYGKYANRCVVNALKRYGKVFSTHKEQTPILFSDGTSHRDGYVEATPL